MGVEAVAETRDDVGASDGALVIEQVISSHIDQQSGLYMVEIGDEEVLKRRMYDICGQPWKMQG